MSKITILVKICLLLSLIFAVGCGSHRGTVETNYRYDVNTSKSIFEDKDILIKIEPLSTEALLLLSDNNLKNSFNGFILTIENKTPHELILDWNKTYFLDNGQAKGGFMFEEVSYSKRNEPKQPLLVLPKSKRAIEIYPNINVYMKVLPYQNKYYTGGSFLQCKPMSGGSYGLYATVNIKNKESKINITMDISPPIPSEVR